MAPARDAFAARRDFHFVTDKVSGTIRDSGL